jgi:hypothetical protein
VKGRTKKNPVKKTFVVCVRSDGYEASLDIGKVYLVIPDVKSAKFGRVRIVDNEEEDYLYPVEYFMPVELSKPARDAASAA